jgi:hypothetical protein
LLRGRLPSFLLSLGQRRNGGGGVVFQPGIDWMLYFGLLG